MNTKKFRMKNILLYCIILLTSINNIIGQQGTFDSTALFEELKTKDSLIFNLGFNNCDTSVLRELLSDDLEFYHDQSGLLEYKEIMIQNMPNLCKMNYKPIRILSENSLEVYPLFAGNQLYGAVQTGIHEFHGIEKDKPMYLTSTAKFTHVWILEKDTWRLKRILSYDHVSPDK